MRESAYELCLNLYQSINVLPRVNEVVSTKAATTTKHNMNYMHANVVSQWWPTGYSGDQSDHHRPLSLEHSYHLYFVYKATSSLTKSADYPVDNFNGHKSIFISELSWLGGRNLFLGIAYIITAVVAMVAGVVLLIIHLFFSKW